MITNKLKLMIGALVIGVAAVVTAVVTTQSSNLDTPTVAEIGAFKGSNSYCSWENYGVDISQPNYPGHIDNQTTALDGTKVYLPNTRNGFKFSSSKENGTYTYTLASAYNRVYVWAAGWSGDTSSLKINDISVNIESNALVANDLDVDIYYDRYAFTLPEATTDFTFTATKRLVIGGVAWYKDIDINNDIVAMDGPEAPEEPEPEQSSSIPTTPSIELNTSEETDSTLIETVVSQDFSQSGYSNEQKLKSIDLNPITITCSTNGFGTKWYDNGAALRVYSGSTWTLSGKTVTKVQLTFGTGGDNNAITVNSGIYNNGTWTGNSNNLIFTVGGSKGNRRIAAIEITYIN